MFWKAKLINVLIFITRLITKRCEENCFDRVNTSQKHRNAASTFSFMCAELHSIFRRWVGGGSENRVGKLERKSEIWHTYSSWRSKIYSKTCRLFTEHWKWLFEDYFPCGLNVYCVRIFLLGNTIYQSGKRAIFHKIKLPIKQRYSAFTTFWIYTFLEVVWFWFNKDEWVPAFPWTGREEYWAFDITCSSPTHEFYESLSDCLFSIMSGPSRPTNSPLNYRPANKLKT